MADVTQSIDNDEVPAPPLDTSQPAKPPPRKRRRVVISCLDCHKRKQKCDRKLPCTNCVQRGKQNTCRYETGTPLNKDRNSSSPSDVIPSTNVIPIKAADFGYSTSGAGASTLGFLRKIEGVASGDLPTVTTTSDDNEHFGSRERYKSLVRHLPARTFVEKLVDLYIEEFNYVYYGIVENDFKEQLDKWYQLPFHLLSSQGPQGIDPELRSFPALVFQILASALLALADEEDENFVSLKYAGNMTFEDLALEYSETGVAILSLLGKRQMTVSTVLAGWVRAGFLKYTGQVTEAWHQVGMSIRDAQEIGLHRDQFDPQPSPGDSPEEALEALWAAESRRRIWQILACWDLHTGAVLGRPTSVDLRTLNRTTPVDTPIPKDRRTTPIFARSENDPPTPLTRSLCMYKCLRPLRDILDLEKEGPFPKDFSKVDKLHQELLELQEQIPAYFRLENPDTQYDHLCKWLVVTRPLMPQLMFFNFMALHRPYIFTRPSSRFEALKASLSMLEAQKIQFGVLNPQQYKTFSLFFGTFDAIVMIASIYILFPKEHPDLLHEALQHFGWGVERFQAMAQRNRLAAAALGVLNAIYIRLKKAIGYGFLERRWPASFVCPLDCANAADDGPADRTADRARSSESTQCHSSANGVSTSMTDASGGSNSTSASSVLPTPDPGTVTNTTDPGISPETGMFIASDWTVPTDFDFRCLPPMYPMGDVAYNDLTGYRDDGFGSGSAGGGVGGPAWPNGGLIDSALEPGADQLGNGDGQNNPAEAPWAFGGEFGNDTIWNLLNHFPPV